MPGRIPNSKPATYSGPKVRLPKLSMSASARVHAVRAETEADLGRSVLKFIRAHHHGPHDAVRQDMSPRSLLPFFQRAAIRMLDAEAREQLARLLDSSGGLGAGAERRFVKILSELERRELHRIVSGRDGLWKRVVGDACKALRLWRPPFDLESGKWITASGDLVFSVIDLMRPKNEELEYALRMHAKLLVQEFWRQAEQRESLEKTEIIAQNLGEQSVVPQEPGVLAEAAPPEAPLPREIALQHSSEGGSKPKRNALGKNVLRLRKECGWSQAQLAYEARVDKKTIIRHEHGKTGHPDTLSSYARAFSKKLGRTVTVAELEES